MIFSFQKLDNFKTVMNLALAVGFITSTEDGGIKVSMATLHAIHYVGGERNYAISTPYIVLCVLIFGSLDVECSLRNIGIFPSIPIFIYELYQVMLNVTCILDLFLIISCYITYLLPLSHGWQLDGLVKGVVTFINLSRY